jgi:DNA modification methylase
MKLKQVIINEKMAYLLGVSIVVLKVLQKIKDLGRRGNLHDTVKPISLMQYLVRLVTPPHGLVLDPFMGSGTTGIACVTQGFKFIGIEKEKEYYEIAKNRILYHSTGDRSTNL